MKQYKDRKIIRLQNYDYSANGAYFITICTHNKEHLFGTVGADSISARMVKKVYGEIIGKYDNVSSPISVVMPNHFHSIIIIERNGTEVVPSVSKIVQEFKRYTTCEYIKLVKNGILKPFDKRIWQRSFYDHIIRNENDFNEIWTYIQNNPLKWQEDCYY
ncbi:transposase [uncultured Ruminococcus sp.]|uniref:transposase n=1 Tax=uncultured Ruminococcus sp. TaxID=165186 RepID=UPI0025D5BF82|nr:transposase [uncultured Ruminococcus sp.]